MKEEASPFNPNSGYQPSEMRETSSTTDQHGPDPMVGNDLEIQPDVIGAEHEDETIGAGVEFTQTLESMPTPEQIEQAASVLRSLSPGFLPKELFLEIARLTPTATIELAPVRRGPSDSVEIYLTQRPDDDPHWPGQWHIPGTVLRSTDVADDFTSGFERVLKDELSQQVEPIGPPTYVGLKFWDVARGREVDHVHYIEVDQGSVQTEGGAFFPSDDLPDNLIEHHRSMIAEILAAYTAANRETVSNEPEATSA